MRILLISFLLLATSIYSNDNIFEFKTSYKGQSEIELLVSQNNSIFLFFIDDGKLVIEKKLVEEENFIIDDISLFSDDEKVTHITKDSSNNGIIITSEKNNEIIEYFIYVASSNKVNILKLCSISIEERIEKRSLFTTFSNYIYVYQIGNKLNINFLSNNKITSRELSNIDNYYFESTFVNNKIILYGYYFDNKNSLYSIVIDDLNISNSFITDQLDYSATFIEQLFFDKKRNLLFSHNDNIYNFELSDNEPIIYITNYPLGDKSYNPYINYNSETLTGFYSLYGNELFVNNRLVLNDVGSIKHCGDKIYYKLINNQMGYYSLNDSTLVILSSNCLDYELILDFGVPKIIIYEESLEKINSKLYIVSNDKLLIDQDLSLSDYNLISKNPSDYIHLDYLNNKKIISLSLNNVKIFNITSLIEDDINNSGDLITNYNLKFIDEDYFIEVIR